MSEASDLDTCLQAAKPRPPAGFADRVIGRVAALEATRRRRRRWVATSASMVAAAAAVVSIWLVRGDRRDAEVRMLEIPAGEARAVSPTLVFQGPLTARTEALAWRVDEGTAVLTGAGTRIHSDVAGVETETGDARVEVHVGRGRDPMTKIVAAGAAVAGTVLTVYVMQGRVRVEPADGAPVALEPGDRGLFTAGAPPLVVRGDRDRGRRSASSDPPIAREVAAPSTADPVQLLTSWLYSRMDHLDSCWEEARSRGNEPQGAFIIRASASQESGRLRASAEIVPGPRSIAGDERFYRCLALAVANPDLGPGSPGATAETQISVLFGKPEDVEDPEWRRRYGLGDPAEESSDDRAPPGFVEVGDSPALGAKDAPVTIIEFSDFQCPFCATAAMTMHRLVLDYGDRVRFVYKNKPLPSHGQAALAAQTAAAAHEQGKFWEMHDLLFSNQDRLDRTSIESYARVIGLDLDRFRRALDQGDFADLIAKDAAVADELGVRGVPTFVINDRVVVGARPYDELKKIIDEELAKSPK
jgi:protein-disulfide isomerase